MSKNLVEQISILLDSYDAICSHIWFVFRYRSPTSLRLGYYIYESIWYVIYGKQLDDLRDATRFHALNAMPEVQQLIVTKTLEKLQSALSAPISFDKIGSITFDAEGQLVLGPFINFWDLVNLSVISWRVRLEHEILLTLKGWSRLESDQLSSYDGSTPQIFF